MSKVSVVLPVFNERARLTGTVDRVCQAMSAITDSYEVIIAEDGSTDGSDLVASMLARKGSRIRHLHSDTRLGRGEAVARTLRGAEGRIVVYLDADLATDLSHLPALVKEIDCGADIATGSRLMKGAQTRRPITRELASRVYNMMARALFGVKISDMQCGFKAFNRESVLTLLDQVESNYWFWDTELIVRASKKGLKVAEFPIRWCHGGESKVKLATDAWNMGLSLVRLWRDIRIDRVKPRVR